MWCDLCKLNDLKHCWIINWNAAQLCTNYSQFPIEFENVLLPKRTHTKEHVQQSEIRYNCVCSFVDIKISRKVFQVYMLNDNIKKVISVWTVLCVVKSIFFCFSSFFQLTSFISNFRIARNKEVQKKGKCTTFDRRKRKTIPSSIWTQICKRTSDEREWEYGKKWNLHHVHVNINVCFALCLRFITFSRSKFSNELRKWNVPGIHTKKHSAVPLLFLYNLHTLLLIIHRIHCCHQSDNGKKCWYTADTDVSLNQIDFHFRIEQLCCVFCKNLRKKKMDHNEIWKQQWTKSCAFCMRK